MIMEAKNISFAYDDKNNIFENINFSVEKGSVFCILGHNGTGKTTLLKCLNGLYTLNSGDILIDGKSIQGLSFNEISKIVGYIPQKHISTFPFSVMDVVLMGRAPYISLTNSPKEDDIEKALNALKILNIYELKDREYTTLSGGEQQLVFLARVLSQEPRVLILDEPTSHLDFGNQVRLLEIINNLSKTGLSVIMSSHFPDHAFSTADKVAIMKDGTFIDYGTPDDVITKDNLKKTYGIEIDLIETPNNQKICVPIRSDSSLNFDL